MPDTNTGEGTHHSQAGGQRLFADESESCLLATVLARPEQADRVRHLPAEHFASPENRLVFAAVMEATETSLDGEAAVVAVAEILRRDGHYSTIGGTDSLLTMMQSGITSQPEQAAREISQAHAAREIAAELEQVRRELSPLNLSGIGERLQFLSKMAESGGQASTLGIRTMADVDAEELRWLWQDWLCRGKFHLFAGPPGQGKSFCLMDLAARLSNGTVWPDGTPVGEPGDTLLMCAEDDPADGIRPRLDAANADCRRVHLLESVARPDDQGRFRPQPVDIQRDFTNIAQHFKSHPDIRLVVIDPMAEFMGRTDSNSTEQVRNTLSGLLNAAARHGVAIIGVNHFRKAASTSALDKAGGSTAFIARARIGMTLLPDPDDPDRKLFLQTKTNLSRKPDGLAFSIVNSQVHWSGDRVTITADEAIQPRKGPAPSARLEAEDWLRDRLQDGWVESRTIDAEGQQMGFSIGTLKRARQSIGAKSEQRREGGVSAWWVGLPVTIYHDGDF